MKLFVEGAAKRRKVKTKIAYEERNSEEEKRD